MVTKNLRRSALVVGMTWLAASAARADDKLYSVDGKHSRVSYRLVHKAHTVVGVAKKNIDGKVKIVGTGAQLMVRIPVGAFDSENSNRDAHMKEVVAASTHPNVELKAIAEGVTPGTSGKYTLRGKLNFHGVSNDVELSVDVSWNGTKIAKVVGHFSISLEAYKVERPSLLFIKVEDKLDLEVDLTITE